MGKVGKVMTMMIICSIEIVHGGMISINDLININLA